MAGLLLRPAVAGLLLIVAAGSHAATPSKDDADGDGVPDTAEALLYTDPRNADTDGDGRNDLEDDAPVSATDPIPADGGLAAFTIGGALVENNYDPAAKRDAPDHLELLVLNGTDAALDGFLLWYSIEDLDRGGTESCFRTLDGFEVPAKGEARIHVDDGADPSHFRANPQGLYARSEAAKTFTVVLKQGEGAPVTVEIAKDAGGAEEAD